MDIHKDQLQIIEILRRLNRIFVRSNDTQSLLSDLCETLVSIKNFSSVWIAVITRNREVLNFEQRGFGVYGTKLKSHLYSKGLNKCAKRAIENGEPFFLEKGEDMCIDCPLLEYKENIKTLVIPVYYQTELLGIITLSVNPDHQLSTLEKTMLIELSEDCGNAINTIQLEQGKNILSETINRLTKSISGKSAREVLDSFMQNLLISLDADYAFIGRVIPGYEDRIRTISVSTSDGIIENFEYTLKGTPCNKVIGKNICCYSSGVADLFPEDIMLKDMGIEAYIGTPLLDSNDKVAGIMVVLKKESFPSETLAQYIFQVFASRGSSELMRYDTEQRILESESQYQNLIESSRNPVYIIVGRNYALVNSAWLNMFEYSIEEVQSPDFTMRNVVEPEFYDLVDRRIDNFLSGISQPLHYEVRGVSKSGKKYDLDVSVTYLNWQGKRAAQGVYRNVTSIKRKERQLQKALKQSREDSQMKTAFLTKLSKEVQSNLSSINKQAHDWLKSIPGNPDTNGFAEKIINNSNNLLDHINDILDISNIELGKMHLNNEKFILSDVLKDVVQYFKPAASKKGLSINCCKKRYNSALVEADPIRVRQILINLISNAVKFTDKGEIQLSYTIRQDDVKITIADTGIGMKPKELKRIYKSFSDPNGKFPVEYDGSGLGLTVTKSLVQLMNGKIWVEPNPDGGSIFNFTIPLA